MWAELKRVNIAAICIAAGAFTACSRPEQTALSSWNPKAAAAYLDQREVTWMVWPSAARAHGTFCISCHTVLPYVLSRPTLRSVLAEQGPSDQERKIFEDVTERVRLWNEIGPYYTDDGYGNGKPAESRGTESVLNALILASKDARVGRTSELTQVAFSNMWALQLTDGSSKGAWPWLQFGMEPWEATDSRYYGAVLAAVAVGVAPENYWSTPAIQSRLTSLRDYLRRESESQSMLNRVVLLWASVKLPGLLNSKEQQSIIREIKGTQEADGGWELSSHAWPAGWSLHSMIRRHLRSDWSRQNSESDGYATGLITFVLQESGISTKDPVVRRGISWLESHQNQNDGAWSSLSLTKRRELSSQTGHFMRDAATAYAVLALTEQNVPAGRESTANRSAKNASFSSAAQSHDCNPRIPGATEERANF